LKQFKIYRMELKDVHIFFCVCWLYPLLLLAFMFIYIFWEWQVNEMGGGGGSLKTCYPKYNNFLLIKTISNNNSRDISMPVGNRSLYRTDVMQSAAKHVNFILQDVHFITQTSVHTPRTLQVRDGMGYCLRIQKLRTSYAREMDEQENPIVGTKSVF
jgi:hypothetical protein